MAAPGGPDDETWRQMSPLARRIYWAVVSLIAGLVLYAFLSA